MLIAQFLDWAEQASAGERADAAFGLARTYLYADLEPYELGEAEQALTILLDDPSALVRRSLAEAFATAVDAPRHLVLALASDQSDVAVIVLERSTLLDDADLIDAVAVGDTLAQSAVARRPHLSAAVAGALAEVGSADAALALCLNGGADLSRFALDRLIARFGRDGRIREAVASRSDLGADIRHGLVMATANALSDFVVRCQWMSPERAARMVQDAGDRAALSIAAGEDLGSDEASLRGFAVYLRTAGHLTPALMLRALLSRNLALFEAAICDLSGRDEVRVAGLLRSPSGLGFAALYRSAGLPPNLLPVFRAALAALRGVAPAHEPGGRLDRSTVTHVIRACTSVPRDDFGRLNALLRRFDVEAARDEVRLLQPTAAPGLGSPEPAPLMLTHVADETMEPLPVAA